MSCDLSLSSHSSLEILLCAMCIEFGVFTLIEFIYLLHIALMISNTLSRLPLIDSISGYGYLHNQQLARPPLKY